MKVAILMHNFSYKKSMFRFLFYGIKNKAQASTACPFAIQDNECDFNDLLLTFEEYALVWVSEWTSVHVFLIPKIIVIILFLSATKVKKT